jgi:hypothetical protein
VRNAAARAHESERARAPPRRARIIHAHTRARQAVRG